MCVSANLPNPTELIAAKCQDLTEFLSGDAVKTYPNLAAVPTYAWKAAGRIGGRIYRIPVERARIGHSLSANLERLKQAGIWVPEIGGIAVDDFTKGLQQLSGRKQWGMGVAGLGAFGFNSIMPAFGSPNAWSVKDGQFNSYIETDEFRAGLEQLAKWKQAGVYRADPLSHDASLGIDFQTGITATVSRANVDFTGNAVAIKDGFTLETVRPFKPSNGARPGHWFSPGADYTTVLKKASKDRIKLLLRVLDYMAAPFGTKEYELITYGVEGTHFERSADGSPALNETALNGDNKDTLGIAFMACSQQVLFLLGLRPGRGRPRRAPSRLPDRDRRGRHRGPVGGSALQDHERQAERIAAAQGGRHEGDHHGPQTPLQLGHDDQGLEGQGRRPGRRRVRQGARSSPGLTRTSGRALPRASMGEGPADTHHGPQHVWAAGRRQM